VPPGTPKEEQAMPARSSGVIAAAFLAALPMAASAEGRLTVELNKFEEADSGSCRAFFLFRNETGMSFEGFEMSLAILDRGGVIDRLLSVDAAPLPVARTTLKLFEIPDTGCAAVSEILLHDVPVCKPENADPADCFALMDLVSRTPAALVK
jgi:hypothetical protein